jgi:hypothetical protein
MISDAELHAAGEAFRESMNGLLERFKALPHDRRQIFLGALGKHSYRPHFRDWHDVLTGREHEAERAAAAAELDATTRELESKDELLAGMKRHARKRGATQLFLRDREGRLESLVNTETDF